MSRGPLIREGWNTQREVEKRMKYRFWDKERRRSNRANAQAEKGFMAAICALRHSDIAWSGPPHDKILRYVCVTCNMYASEDMIKDMGFDFNECPDFIIHDLMDEGLKQQAVGNFVSRSGNGIRQA